MGMHTPASPFFFAPIPTNPSAWPSPSHVQSNPAVRPPDVLLTLSGDGASCVVTAGQEINCNPIRMSITSGWLFPKHAVRFFFLYHFNKDLYDLNRFVRFSSIIRFAMEMLKQAYHFSFGLIADFFTSKASKLVIMG